MSVSSKTTLAGLLGTVIVIALFNYFLDVSGIGARGNERVFESLENVAAIAVENPEMKKTMVLGSSISQVSFSPYDFDSELEKNGIDMLSYNFGFGGLNPKVQEIFSREFIANFKAGNPQSKLDLAILEFNPFQTTIARKKLDAYIEDRNFSMLMSAKRLWEFTLENPTRGIRIFVIKYLRQGFSAQLLTNGISSMMMRSGGSSNSDEVDKYYQEYQRLEDEYVEAREKDIPGNFNRGRWFADMRGGRMNTHLLSDKTLQLLRNLEIYQQDPINMQSYLDYRIYCCDIVGLHFDQELLDGFVDLVNNYKEISTNVRVLLYPLQIGLVKYSPETQKRLDDALDYVAERTGVPIDNFQLIPEINDSHFVDASHLTLTNGTIIFSEYLANYYKDLLQ